MSAAANDLCEPDALILQALAVENNHAVVVIELLRARVEGLLRAAALIAAEGARAPHILKRAVRVTANIVAVDLAQRDLRKVAEHTDDTSSEFMSAYCHLLEATHTARMDLLRLCFVDESPRAPDALGRQP